MHTPAIPATDVQIVSDDTLRLLARHDPQRALGELDAEDQAILCMTLGDICDELLRWRKAARTRPSALALALRSEAIATRLENARRTIRAPGPLDQATLRAACETLLRHSTDPAERTAATEVLAQMQEAA
ncbi:hypothetical protein [Roseovarius pacificus]|uniref:hypothetical protein n=1 Tax=Roseovarius pacificus TaxID=337701 RepID=UPI002A18DA4A|nr:hypothetical protein [Roseovarius pacificus]